MDGHAATHLKPNTADSGGFAETSAGSTAPPDRHGTPHLAAAHGFLHERIGEMDRLIAANPNWTEPYLRRALLSVPPR
jgi:hypothetical protein